MLRLASVAWLLVLAGAGDAIAQAPPASVMPLSSSSGNLCAGVKVSSRIVLTAGHCVGLLTTWVSMLDSSGTVVMGTVQAIHGMLDLALVCVPPMAAPVAALAASVPAVNDPVQIGGFSGGKWSGTTIVTATDPVGHAFVVDTLTPSPTAARPCPGDSGSPAFRNGQVVGIAKSTMNGACGEPATYQSTPGLGSWIAQGDTALSCKKFIDTMLMLQTFKPVK